jgi:hypothetical protein
MAVTVDATIGTKTSNSYCDVAYADAYFLQHYNTVKAAAWAALTTTQKNLALVNACRVIETARFTVIVNWYNYQLKYDRNTGLILNLNTDLDPVKLDYFQKLQFPRNLDIDSTTGSAYIPESVQMAQCEQAVYLLTLDETALSNRIQGVVNDTVGVGRGAIHLNQQYASEGSTFAPLAFEYVRPFFLKSGARYRRA